MVVLLYYLLYFLTFVQNNFLTGHRDFNEKIKSKEKIISDIDIVISYGLLKNELTKDKLIKEAENNNWRGSIKIRRSHSTNKIYLIYEPEYTPLQHLGISASQSIKI